MKKISLFKLSLSVFFLLAFVSCVQEVEVPVYYEGSSAAELSAFVSFENIETLAVKAVSNSDGSNSEEAFFRVNVEGLPEKITSLTPVSLYTTVEKGSSSSFEDKTLLQVQSYYNLSNLKMNDSSYNLSKNDDEEKLNKIKTLVGTDYYWFVYAKDPEEFSGMNIPYEVSSSASLNMDGIVVASQGGFFLDIENSCIYGKFSTSSHESTLMSDSDISGFPVEITYLALMSDGKYKAIKITAEKS